MWQERPSELLRNEIEEVLKSLAEVPGLNDLAREPLKKTRRALNDESPRDYPWPLLPLMVSEAICGRHEHAVPAAAALEFLLAAGDVFDDIEDNDSSEALSAKYGSAVATNIATILLILAERAITRLNETKVKESTIVRVMYAVNSFYTTTCAGQHLDISLTPEESISEEVYLRVIGMKSASQVECACNVGALLAKANQNTIDSFTKFGYNLGMASQITNDIQGIINEGDIFKSKITLPVIYALSQDDNQERNQLELLFIRKSPEVLNPTQAKDLLFRTGAIHYAMVKMECYKQEALDILSELEKSGIKTKQLKLFLK